MKLSTVIKTSLVLFASVSLTACNNAKLPKAEIAKSIALMEEINVEMGKATNKAELCMWLSIHNDNAASMRDLINSVDIDKLNQEERDTAYNLLISAEKVSLVYYETCL